MKTFGALSRAELVSAISALSESRHASYIKPRRPFHDPRNECPPSSAVSRHATSHPASLGCRQHFLAPSLWTSVRTSRPTFGAPHRGERRGGHGPGSQSGAAPGYELPASLHQANCYRKAQYQFVGLREAKPNSSWFDSSVIKVEMKKNSFRLWNTLERLENGLEVVSRVLVLDLQYAQL
jgi:hypothetical protein